MPDALAPSRRTVLVAAAGAAAAASAPALAAAEGARAIVVFEAEEPAARSFVQARVARGDTPAAVDGDRIRFARRLFREERPAKVLGMTRYADFLLLADTAREEGYRTALIDQAPPDGAALFLWTAERA